MPTKLYVAPKFTIDPQANLDYVFDWTDWLDDVDAIESANVSADAGLTVGLQTINDKQAIAWIHPVKVGGPYICTAHIVTSAGREDDRSCYFTVKER